MNNSCFHIHTSLCGHASGKMEEYVINARNNGVKILGFSDHIPFNEYEYQDVDSRMNILDLEKYYTEIKVLKNKYSDIHIYTGFEAEYKKENIEYLARMRKSVDYLLLGQHFVNGVDKNNNKDYPLIYAKSLIEAMETGLFDIVVHPDIFLSERKTIILKDDIEVFDNNSIAASRAICQAAKRLNIPLEINLLGVRDNRDYPSNLFFQIAKENDNEIVVGVDAHLPENINTINEDIERALKIINVNNLNIVNDFDVVKNRSGLLDMKIAKALASSMSYESYFIHGALESILNKLPNDLEKDAIEYEIDKEISVLLNNAEIEGINNDRKLADNMQKVALSNQYSYEEKSYRLNRIKDAVTYANSVLINRQGLINEMSVNIKKAFEMNVSNKNELLDLVTKLSQLKYTIDSSKRRIIMDQIEKYNNNLSSNSTKLIKTNPNFKEEKDVVFEWASGFAHITVLAILLTFIMGVAVGIALEFLGII